MIMQDLQKDSAKEVSFTCSLQTLKNTSSWHFHGSWLIQIPGKILASTMLEDWITINYSHLKSAVQFRQA